MDFNSDLSTALAANGGKLTFQQAVDLLPHSAKSKVMTHLTAASRAGVIDLRVKRVAGELQILISNPVQPQTGGD